MLVNDGAYREWRSIKMLRFVKVRTLEKLRFTKVRLLRNAKVL